MNVNKNTKASGENDDAASGTRFAKEDVSEKKMGKIGGGQQIAMPSSSTCPSSVAATVI